MSKKSFGIMTFIGMIVFFVSSLILIEKLKVCKADLAECRIMKAMHQEACMLYVYNADGGTWNRWDGTCTEKKITAERLND